jgi:hypothetical protein
MISQNVALGPLQKKTLYSGLALLWLSGVFWLYFQFLANQSEGTVSLVQTWSLKIHGAAAMAFLVILGALLPVHVRLAWKQNRNRVAGAWLLSLNAFLILTGWMLYYTGNEMTRPWISALHWGVGLGLPFFVYLHIRFARRYPGKVVFRPT